jgi:hypothetical protein
MTAISSFHDATNAFAARISSRARGLLSRFRTLLLCRTRRLLPLREGPQLAVERGAGALERGMPTRFGHRDGAAVDGGLP